MKVGVLGYPGVGKSTVFAALTGAGVDGPASGTRMTMVDVVDRRLDHLRDVFAPKRFTRARFEIEECPPLPGADTKRRGEVISALRSPDAFLLVVGCFDMAQMLLDGPLRDPGAQLASLREELLLFDLEAVEQRRDRIVERRLRGAVDRGRADREISLLDRMISDLEDGRAPAGSPDADVEEMLAELRLLTRKPAVAVFNVDEDGRDPGVVAAVHRAAEAWHGHAAVMCAPVEQEIGRIEDEEDRRAFLAEYDLEAPASERLTRLAYDALDLISFFTVGEDEVKAWPIRSGSTAVAAAGKIHTDLARGFIRAEVTPYDRVASAGDPGEFKRSGAADLKGRDYVVQDGDSISVRFGV